MLMKVIVEVEVEVEAEVEEEVEVKEEVEVEEEEAEKEERQCQSHVRRAIDSSTPGQHRRGGALHLRPHEQVEGRLAGRCR